MTVTLAQARDAVITVVDVAWKAAPASAALTMLYDNVVGDRPGESASTTQNEAWARTTVRTIGSDRTTQGTRRYQTDGLVTVQIFTPSGDGHTLGDALTKIVVDALRAHTSSADSIWFFGVTPIEIGQDGPWFNVNVDASFRYQEV